MGTKPLIGVNLYSVRDFCKTEEDLDRTFARLKAIGYPSVQISGVGPIPPERIRVLLDRHGLVACAAHDSLEALTQRPDEVIAKLKALNCSFTALGYPGDEYLKTENIPALRDHLVGAAKKLQAAGLKLGYHNHAQEFLPYQGTTMLGWLCDNTPADLLWGEPDTCWVQLGGGSPVAWIHRLAGRIPAIHLKDYQWVDGKARVCEVGHGNLDWPGIFAACSETKIPVWIVEQDNPVPERDIFASLELSLASIKAYLG